MLSSVAERVYWFARYLERAENTARLVKVNTLVLLDLPMNLTLGGEVLIKITGSEKAFYKKFKNPSQANIEKFVLGDPENLSSVRSAIRAARENLRTTRDIMPSETWEQINEIYRLVDDRCSGRGLKQEDRHDFLDTVISHCQGITGLLAGTMSHGQSYQFLRMGRNLERADMTTRILDSGAAIDVANGWAMDDRSLYRDSLWANVLQSLSANQMYRKHVRRPINNVEVARFLLQDANLPRSVVHCLNAIIDCMGNLPHCEDASRSALHVKRIVSDLDSKKLSGGPLHEFIDQLQLELLEIGKSIAITWFPKVGKITEKKKIATSNW